MEQMSETLKLKFPVYYLADDGIIYDSDNEWVCDVDDPINDHGDGVINARGEFIAAAINEKFERLNAEVPALEVGAWYQGTGELQGRTARIVENTGRNITSNIYKEDVLLFINEIHDEERFTRLFPTRIEKGQSNGE